MTARPLRRPRALATAIAVAVGLAAAAAATPAGAVSPTWRLEQPIPPGSASAGPLGPPAALRFLGPSRGLLQTQGTGGSPAGLWTYDGRSWTLLSTVCGAHGDHGGIAVAGPDEFWTVSDPAVSTPTTGGYASDFDVGTTLCHFRDGRVVDSYAVPPTEPTRTFSMRAAVCLSPDDCWFAGNYGVTPDGGHAGVFHLHWDGREIRRVFIASDRAASGLATFDGAVWESSFEGRMQFRRTNAQPPDTATPALVHTLSAAGSADDPLRLDATVTTSMVGYGDDPYRTQLDLNAITANPDGSDLWAVGAGAESGGWWGIGYGQYPNDMTPPVLPVGAVRLPGGAFEQLRFGAADAAQLAPDPSSWYDRKLFTDVGPIPGSAHEAWIGVSGLGIAAQQNGVDAKRLASASLPARVVRVRYTPGAAAGQPNAAILETVTLPTPAGRGALRRVACTGPADCWAATTEGWLYHWTDGAAAPRDDDPAYSRLIAIRPPDGRTPQPLPDDDPVDDSRRFAPPPEIITVPAPTAPGAAAPAAAVQRIGALITAPHSRAIGRDRIAVRFQLARPAKVGLAGELHGRVVARARARKMAPGDQEIVLHVDPRRRPKRLRFATRELALTASTMTTEVTRAGDGIAARVAAPAAGDVTVTVAAAGRVAALARRTITLRAAAVRTVRLTVPRAFRSRALTVGFAFRAAPSAAGPSTLAAQRLLDPLPVAPRSHR